MVLALHINDFSEHLSKKVHNLSTDSIRIALSNTAPAAQGSNPTLSNNGILANVTQISYANYADTLAVDRVLEGVTSEETAGNLKFDANDFTISASGGALASFRYIYIWNDTATTPVDALICCIDNEAAITLADGESLSVQFNAAGIVTVTKV